MNIKCSPVKVLSLLIGIAFCIPMHAQDHVPSGLRYQAVVRNQKGKPLTERDIVAKMQIVDMDKAAIIWEELHYTSSNELGLFQVTIGEGHSTGEGRALGFESIDWGKGSIALQVDVDFGEGFISMGMAELESVPYAFLADSSLKAPLPDMKLGQIRDVSNKKPTKNQPLIWNGQEWVPGDSLKIQNLLIQGDVTANQDVFLKGALKIGDSGLITGITSDPGLTGATDETIPTTAAVKKYVDDLQESGDNQQLSFEESNKTLTLDRGGSVDLTSLVNDPDADPGNELQDLQMNANVLTISGINNPTEIDLSPFQGVNTDNQVLSLNGTVLDISGGNDVDLSTIQDGTEDADADPSNELQILSLSGTDLTISDGNTVDLGNLPDEVDDADADPTNELQDISLNSTFLSISNGSTIDLSPIQDGYEPNTDDQNLSVAGHQLSIESGNTITLPDNVNDADADPTNEIQDISLSSTFLSITDGSTIDLAPIRDGYEPNTDDQNLILDDHHLTIEGGNTVILPDNVDDLDADPANELQTLSITGSTITISNGNSINLPPGVTDADADSTNEIQDLSLENNILTITKNDIATPINLAQYSGVNTDEQELTLTGTELFISGGNSVDLSILPDAVDDADSDPTNELQDISLAGTELTISSGSTVNLSVIQDGYEPDTDDQNLSITGHSLSIENGNTVTLPDLVNDADADPANELQDISLSGTNLSISDGSTLDLGILQDGYDPNTDNQNLILNGHLLTIERGNAITLPDNVDDADADPFNELQDISLTGTNLSITDGSTVDLSIIDTDTRLTESEVDAYVSNNGYLTNESDPVFSASPAAGILQTDINHWDLAYSWGDHALAGYLTSYSESDPIFMSSVAAGITLTNINLWNDAYSWGDHALEGYLTYETDPVFSASPAASITDTDINHWDLAYSWGNHAWEGYLTYETDPVFSGSVAAGITSTDTANWNEAYSWGDHSLMGYLTYETDPVFSSSPAAGITNTDINHWDLAYSWGNHALAGYLTSYSESDPIFMSSVAAGITLTNINLWNDAYSWGDHALAGYLTYETDPVFSSSPAASITNSDINTWNGYVNYWNLTGSDIYVLGRHVGIGTSSPAASLHVANNDVVFTAPYTLPGTPANPSVEGQGTRLLWYADKSAFRAGSVQGTNWNRDQIGDYSFAMGNNPLASGDHSISMGNGTQATGTNSVAIGNGAVASGENSIAMAGGNAASARSIAIGMWSYATGASAAIGEDAQANGAHSTALGFQTVADGNYSTVMGLNTRTSGGGYGATAMGSGSHASNYGSTAMGASSLALGETSTAMGYHTQALGEYSTATGTNTIAAGYNSFSANMLTHAQSYASSVFGRYNIIDGDSLLWIDSDPLFVIGNGSSVTARNNAVTVYKNGDMDVDGDVTADRFFGDGSGLTGVGGIQCLSWNSSTRRLSIDGCAGDVYISDYWEPNTDYQSLDNAYGYGRIITTDYGDVSIRGTYGLEVYNDINLGLNVATDNDRINFDYSTTMEYLEWNNSNDAFLFSEDIQLLPGHVFRNSSGSLAYNSLTTSGTSSPVSGRMDNSGDLFIQDDLEVGDDLYIQDLYVNGNVYGININDADYDPTNELQTIGLSGYTLSLSPSGGSLTLPWANNGSAYTYTNRNVGINTSTPATDFVIYNSAGSVEMDYDEIALWGQGVKKVSISSSTGYPGWIGTKGPGDSYNAVIGYVSGYNDFGSIAVLNDGSNFRAGMQVNSNGTGILYGEGPNDNTNFIATFLTAGYENNGYASVNDINGNWQARMYVATSGIGVVEADYITATTKAFRIPHPDKPGYDIVYTCIEGPEVAAYVRGTAQLTNGTAEIVFPEHFQIIASENSMTVMITPLSADSKGLAVVGKDTNGFLVQELYNGTGTYAFDWEAKCVRKGHEDFEVIQESFDTEIGKSSSKIVKPKDKELKAL